MLTAVRPDSPQGLAVLRRTVAGSLAGTGLVVLLVPALTAQTQESTVAHVAIALAVLTAGVVLGLTRRSGRAGIEVLVLVTAAMAGVLVWLSEPLTVEPWLVLVPVTLLATFCAVDVAVTGVVVAVVALGCGAFLADPVDPPLAAVGAAALAAGVLGLIAWTTARTRGPRPGHGGTAALVDAAELAERLDGLAEQAIATGSGLAVVLVAPDGGHVGDGRDVALRVAARSREDDVVAVLDDAIAVALPGAGAAEATVYAARVVVHLQDGRTGGPGGTDGAQARVGAAVGVATIRDAADGADVLLRRARRALHTAVLAGPGTIGVEGTDGVAQHWAEDIAAVPSAGRAQD